MERYPGFKTILSTVRVFGLIATIAPIVFGAVFYLRGSLLLALPLLGFVPLGVLLLLGAELGNMVRDVAVNSFEQIELLRRAGHRHAPCPTCRKGLIVTNDSDTGTCPSCGNIFKIPT